jgi:hypothetical protein
MAEAVRIVQRCAYSILVKLECPADGSATERALVLVEVAPPLKAAGTLNTGVIRYRVAGIGRPG